jgi:hypothetical protein
VDPLLILVLVLLLCGFGAGPWWGWSWGWGPSGVLWVLFVVILLYALLGRRRL